MSYTQEAFSAAIKHLAELNGLDEELAGELMVYIGDTPEDDGDGWVIAKDRQGKVYRLRWPSEGEDGEEEDGSGEEDSE